MNVPICPACRKNPRRGGQYLCRGCWYTLPPGTRTALNRRDDDATRRLSNLHEALQAGTPLRDISIR